VEGTIIGSIGDQDGERPALRVEEVGRRMWLAWEGDAPELPKALPQLTPVAAASLRWFRGEGWDGSELWGAVTGNSGAEGFYVLGVYVLPVDGVEPRYPTFDEWAALGAVACVPGVMLACSVIVGSELIDPPDGRCLIVTQTGTIAGTPAARRLELLSLGGINVPRA